MYLWIKRFGFLIGFIYTSTSYATDPAEDWKTLSSDHFNVHFLESYTPQAKRAAYIAEIMYKEMSHKFSWQPDEKISMVVTDEYDRANGSATPIPFNKVVLRLSPPNSPTQLDDYDDWLALLIEHELTHIFHLDKSIGKVSRFRSTFGRYLLLFPNLLQPAWFIEGLATYHETHQGIGRGQSSSFEMLMREEVEKGLLPVATVNLPPDSQPFSQHYLYGVYFYQFVKDMYGEESIKKLIDTYSNNLLPFAINSNSKSVFGKNVTKLWAEFSGYLTKRFSKQLIALRKAKQKASDTIVSHPHSLSPIKVFNKQSFIYIEDDSESPAQLILQSTDSKKSLLEINSNSRFDIGSDNFIYITQPDFCDEYRIYYDLYRYDVMNNDIEQLTRCSRYQQISVTPSNKIAAVKTIASIPQIDLLDNEGKFSSILWKGQYGDVVNTIDWSESEKTLLVSKKSLNTNWAVYEFNLNTKRWSDVISGESAYMQAQYSPDQTHVLFSSDITGVYNIYKHSLLSNKTVALTDVISGAFSPLEFNKKLYYQRFERGGYQILATDLNVAEPVEIKTNDKIIPRFPANPELVFPDYKLTDYSPLSDLKPRYWLPSFSIENEASEIGFITSSQDSLDHHYYQLNLGYGLEREELIGLFLYQYDNWLSFLLSKENSVYTNSVTELTDLVRANQQTQIRFTLPFTRFADRWRFNLGLITNKDSDSYRAPGIAGFIDSNDDLLGISVYYDSKRSFIKGSSPETGRDVLFVTESSDVLNSDFSGKASTLDWREFFRLGSHHSLAIRYVSGKADQTMRPYKLGGLKSDFDKLTVFNTQVSRAVFNKRNFSLRGYSENNQIGNNIELASIEWRFPLQQVAKGIMAPPVGVMKHSGRLFTEAGSSWNDNSEKNIVSSVGAEWLIDLNLFYRLTFQLRLGYAEGLDIGGDKVTYVKFGGAF